MSDVIMRLIEKFSVSGFLGTRALLYMDITILFLSILPLLLAISIFFAIKGHYRTHKFTQTLLFLSTLLMLSFFAYIVHYHDGFETLLQKSNIEPQRASLFLLSHIVITLTTTILWFSTLIYGIEDRKRRALPGVYSHSHKKSGRRVFIGVLLTSITSIGLYWALFVA